MAELKYNAKISERIDMGPETALFRVVPDNGIIPDFKPGQFATLGLLGGGPRHPLAKPDPKPLDPNKIIQRAYSIASSPLNKNYLEFYIVMVKEGIITPRLWNLKIGDPLFLGNKVSGHFVMEGLPPEAHIIFIATGTGLAPYISMLYTFLKGDQKRKFSLFHGVRTSQDLGYRSELTALENICPHFSYFPIISRPQLDPIPWKGPAGHVQKLWEEKVVSKKWGFDPLPGNTHIFLCGSPQMIDGMVELLGQSGFKENKKDSPGQIHVERYW